MFELEAAVLRMQAEVDRLYPLEGESIVRHVLVSVGEQPTSGGAVVANAAGPLNRGSHVGEVSVELVRSEIRPPPAWLARGRDLARGANPR